MRKTTINYLPVEVLSLNANAGEDNMISAIVDVDGTQYEFAEYYDYNADCLLESGPDSHLRVNGIREISSGNQRKVISVDMDRQESYVWDVIESFVCQCMVDHLEAVQRERQ